jgi:hypothetical protein
MNTADGRHSYTSGAILAIGGDPADEEDYMTANSKIGSGDTYMTDGGTATTAGLNAHASGLEKQIQANGVWTEAENEEDPGEKEELYDEAAGYYDDATAFYGTAVEEYEAAEKLYATFPVYNAKVFYEDAYSLDCEVCDTILVVEAKKLVAEAGNTVADNAEQPALDAKTAAASARTSAFNYSVTLFAGEQAEFDWIIGQGDLDVVDGNKDLYGYQHLIWINGAYDWDGEADDAFDAAEDEIANDCDWEDAETYFTAAVDKWELTWDYFGYAKDDFENAEGIFEDAESYKEACDQEENCFECGEDPCTCGP